MSPALAFVRSSEYAQLSGQSGRSRHFRVVTHARDAAVLERVAQRIEAALDAEHIRVRMIVTETMMRKDVDGHFDLLIGALLFIAVLMALVGAVGLASAMGSNVAERSREFGIMRSIGATPNMILRNVLGEGAIIGMMSIPLALVLSLPLSMALGAFIGDMLFGLAFPLAFSPMAVLIWIALVQTGAALASALPARRAAHCSVHQALSWI